MAVKTYSRKKDGEKRLQPNFRVKEWASPDGGDKILIDTDMPPYLQIIRDNVDGVVTIEVISGYRTQAYNDSLPNSSKNSQHLQGKAADIRAWLDKDRTKYLHPKYLCCAAEILGIPGIGLMQTSIHVDVRTSGKSYFDENFKNTRIEKLSGNHKSWFTYCGVKNLDFMSNPFKKPTDTLRKGARSEQVKWLQFELIKRGFLPLISASGKCNVDGVFGSDTEKAVKTYQFAMKLEVDGKFGPLSRAAMK